MLNNAKLVELRRKKHLTQSELAAKIGITDSHLSHVEKGKVGMSMATLRATAQALETSIEELLSEDMQAPPPPEPGIVFEYSFGKDQKGRCVLPANAESYAFLSEQIKPMCDPQLREVAEMWTEIDEDTKKKILSLLKESLKVPGAPLEQH